MLWKELEGDGGTSEGRMESKKHTFTGISSYRVGISIINAPYALRMSGLMNGYSRSAGACILAKVSWEGVFYSAGSVRSDRTGSSKRQRSKEGK